MPEVKRLLSMADLEAVLASSREKPLLVFKHSTTCPRSARAHREWEEFLGSPVAGKVNLAFVRVIQERPVSLALAERVQVRHESPQAMLIKDGKALWHDSHARITVQALAAAVERHV